MRRRRVALLIASALLVAACSTPGHDLAGRDDGPAPASTLTVSPHPAATPARSASSAATGPTATVGGTASASHVAAALATARAQLARLSVVPVPALVGYRRAAFGEAWEDVDHNGCNTREDVLFSSVIRTMRWSDRSHGGCDHDMLSGSWRDPYTGRLMTFTNLKNEAQAQAIQIDHQVALATAWRYGASKWTDEERLEFANWQPNLVAVSGAVNLEKGDLEPGDWRPAAGEQCGFSVRVINTLSVWHLALSREDQIALQAMLATCR